MKKKDIFNGFTLFIVIVCLLTLTLNMVNKRFWLADFRVYYSAAHQLLSGGQVYNISFDSGSGYYKYSPVMLLVFLPYCIFSYPVASLIHFVILGVAFWYTFILIRDLLKTYLFKDGGTKEYLLLFFSSLSIMLYLSRELYLGNINILLLMLCCLSLRSFLSGKPLPGSLFLSIVFIAKPYYLLLLLPLLIRKKWKALTGITVIIATEIILAFIISGPSQSIRLYTEWFNVMLTHDQDFPTRNSLEYILQHNLIPSLPEYSQYIIFALICLLGALFIYRNIIFERNHPKPGLAESDLCFELFLLIALLPNLVKADWAQFMLSTPIIAFMIFYIAKQKIYWLIPVLVILFFFFSANSDDLLGSDLSHKLFMMGLMGISNLFLVVLSLFLFLDYRKKETALHQPLQ